MRIRPRFVAVTAALYAVLGELYYRDVAPVAGPGGTCVHGSAVNYQAIAVAAGLLIFVVSSGVLARRAAIAWAGATALNAGLGLAAGMIGARMIYRARLHAAPPCPGLEFCGGFGCMASPYADVVTGLVLVAAAAMLAVPVGWIARRIPPRVAAPGRVDSR